MNHKTKTIDTYDKIAPGFNKAHFNHFWIEEFEEYKKLIDGNKVVDIGCGAGRDASIFIGDGFDYTGIDASEGMLKVARGRVPDGTFLLMDFYHLDFAPETFDGFWAAASLLHVPKKEVGEVLTEIKKITKQNGAGFISIKEKTDKNEVIIQENKYGVEIARYFAFYEQDEFKGILERNGFKVIKMSKKQENDERKTVWLCYFVRT
ncbi:MAG: class I SAM-dependent methyltransferase [Patescibacteria group bacterium]